MPPQRRVHSTDRETHFMTHNLHTPCPKIPARHDKPNAAAKLGTVAPSEANPPVTGAVPAVTGTVPSTTGANPRLCPHLIQAPGCPIWTIPKISTYSKMPPFSQRFFPWVSPWQRVWRSPAFTTSLTPTCGALRHCRRARRHRIRRTCFRYHHGDCGCVRPGLINPGVASAGRRQ